MTHPGTDTVAAAPSARPLLAVSPLTAVVGGIGAVLLLISPLGVTWLFSPAVAAEHIPALSLNWAGLHRLTDSGMAPTTWIQKNYFTWLGWLLIIAAIVATAAAALIRSRPARLTATAVSVLGLVVGFFAAKGALTLSQFSHQVPNLRAGAYLLIVGLLLTLAASLIPARR